MKPVYIMILLLANLVNAGTANAQSELLSNMQLELIPYVDSNNPTDTLLDYYCVLTLTDTNATSTIFVNAGTKKDTADRFDNAFYVTAKSISGVNKKTIQTGITNSKAGNKVRIYIGRYHFELMYLEVTAKDERGNSLGRKTKDMRKSE